MSDLYADWAPYYPPRAHNPLMEIEQAAMVTMLPPLSAASVLDAGCGTGRYGALLRRRDVARVVGIDRSAAMLRLADPASRRVLGDLRALPFTDETFDVVVSGLVVIDIPELPRVAQEWCRVTKPRGVVLYSTLHPNGAKFGWTRTFDTPRGTHALPAYWHAVAEHREACAAAGLAIEQLVEPSLRDPRTNVSTSVAVVVRARRVN